MLGCAGLAQPCAGQALDVVTAQGSTAASNTIGNTIEQSVVDLDSAYGAVSSAGDVGIVNTVQLELSLFLEQSFAQTVQQWITSLKDNTGHALTNINKR